MVDGLRLIPPAELPKIELAVNMLPEPVVSASIPYRPLSARMFDWPMPLIAELPVMKSPLPPLGMGLKPRNARQNRNATALGFGF